MKEFQSDERNVVLDTDLVTSQQLLGLYEWLKIGAGNNMPLLAKLWRNVSSHYLQTYGGSGSTRLETLIVPRLFEHLHPTRYEIFTTST